MASSDVLYVKGENSVSEQDTDEDVWDDRKLNDAYDKALKMANKEIAQRVAMSTNSKKENAKEDKEEEPGQMPEEGSDPLKNDKKPTKQQKKAMKKEAQKKETIKWKEGMSCRAIYLEDGQEYEATVTSLIDEQNCIVKFVGYKNSQVVPLETLKPSLGKNARKRQAVIAESRPLIDLVETSSDDEQYAGLPIPSFPVVRGLRDKLKEIEFQCLERALRTLYKHSTPDEHYPTSPQRKPRKQRMPRMPRMPNMPDMPMPHMPMPDMPMPHLPRMRKNERFDMPIPPPPLPCASCDCGRADDQSLASMLLSWYMSGYHTGMYQGMKRARGRHT